MDSRVRLAAAPKTLRTARVLLESSRADHAAAFAEGVAASGSSLTYVSWGRPERDLAWARAFLRAG